MLSMFQEASRILQKASHKSFGASIFTYRVNNPTDYGIVECTHQAFLHSIL